MAGLPAVTVPGSRMRRAGVEIGVIVTVPVVVGSEVVVGAVAAGFAGWRGFRGRGR